MQTSGASLHIKAKKRNFADIFICTLFDDVENLIFWYPIICSLWHYQVHMLQVKDSGAVKVFRKFIYHAKDTIETSGNNWCIQRSKRQKSILNFYHVAERKGKKILFQHSCWDFRQSINSINANNRHFPTVIPHSLWLKSWSHSNVLNINFRSVRTTTYRITKPNKHSSKYPSPTKLPAEWHTIAWVCGQVGKLWNVYMMNFELMLSNFIYDIWKSSKKSKIFNPFNIKLSSFSVHLLPSCKIEHQI